MTRSAAHRSSAVQAEKPLSSISSEGGSARASSAVPWYWRLALFLWTTSYVCLLGYEWLAGLLKSWYTWRTGH